MLLHLIILIIQRLITFKTIIKFIFHQIYSHGDIL